jgi:putative oxidoreductase
MINCKIISRLTYLGARWILGVVFIYASYDKLFHPQAFADIIYHYQILPDRLINATALFLPWLELLMGICLITGFWMPGTVLWCNFLLVVYIGALSFNLARGLNIDCGCFSTAGGRSIDIETILLDLVFLALSIYLFIVVFGSRSGEG